MDESSAALRNLKAFNRMTASHPELSARLIKGEYDVLQWRQAQLYTAFREYYAHPAEALGAARAQGKMTPSLLVSGAIACVLTAWTMLVHGKRDVVIFSVDKISADKDHDFRIDGLYRFLREKKLRFTEVFHTQLGKPTLAYAWSRKRAAVYHEAFEFLAALWFRHGRCNAEARAIAADLTYEEFGEADRPFARALVERTLRSVNPSLYKIRRYREVLMRLRPCAVLAIDDTRYYQELCAAARSLKIPFYAFQHGGFTKYHAGWLASGAGEGNDVRPDALFVWSPYWKNELLRLGTNFKEDEIRIGGNPKGDALSTQETQPYAPPNGAETINVLVPFETDASFDEVAAILKTLTGTGRVKIFLKTRPDWDVQKQMRLCGLDGLSSEEAEAVSDHHVVIDRVHAVAGVYSTFLYDMISYRKPIFILKTSMDVGEGMVVNGLADLFNVDGGHSAERLAVSCQEAVLKLGDRLERYQGGSGRLASTLESLGLYERGKSDTNL